jgi:hypothetical protein
MNGHVGFEAGTSSAKTAPKELQAKAQGAVQTLPLMS